MVIDAPSITAPGGKSEATIVHTSGGIHGTRLSVEHLNTRDNGAVGVGVGAGGGHVAMRISRVCAHNCGAAPGKNSYAVAVTKSHTRSPPSSSQKQSPHGIVRSTHVSGLVLTSCTNVHSRPGCAEQRHCCAAATPATTTSSASTTAAFFPAAILFFLSLSLSSSPNCGFNLPSSSDHFRFRLPLSILYVSTTSSQRLRDVSSAQRGRAPLLCAAVPTNPHSWRTQTERCPILRINFGTKLCVNGGRPFAAD
mmetsp:Transcript_9458/g.25171  ORF Transcript_9458/g.25171 Transcript_9458/m.25171 type:complete len:252 (+) Transcript_9458:1326-2081(+)